MRAMALGYARGDALRRMRDLVLASIGLLLATPIFILVVLANIKEPQNAFFVHKRIGLRGREFGCLKFRTMCVNADAQLAQLLRSSAKARAEMQQFGKIENDPRVTKLGRFLRRTSLDELPQLINVLRGEMSLVGPRPVTVEELCHYGKQKQLVLSVLPGLTGWWQVNGRNQKNYADRVELDVWYVQNRCIWLDLRILVATVWVVLCGRGAS